jgi:SpoVK/Ycf46/Vps4 family AAA+-type ATPase
MGRTERSDNLAGVGLCMARLLAPPGSGSVVLIDGPPGIGKTALLEALANRARALGIEVLSARAASWSKASRFR